MATKPPRAAAAPEGQPENFKRIKGIKKAAEERLHSKKIFTYTQLAALSPACIAELIGDPSAESIAPKWIKEARKLSSKLPAEEFRYSSDFSIKLMLDGANVVQSTHVVHSQDNLEDEWSDWNDLVNFIVRHAAPRFKPSKGDVDDTTKEEPVSLSRAYFRIVIYPAQGHYAGKIEHIHPQAGHYEGKIPTETEPLKDLDGNVIVDFISKRLPRLMSKQVHPDIEVKDESQAELPYQSIETIPSREKEAEFIKEPFEHAVQPYKPPEVDLRLDVGNMSLEEVGFYQKAGEHIFQKHMRARFNFNFSGLPARQLAAEGLPYFVQIMACDLASGEATLLAQDHQRLRSDLLTYTTKLEFPLPKLGRYQLVGIVLLPDKDQVGVTLGDVLKVVQ